MSLLRACSGALAKPALLRSSLVVRALSSEAAPPTPTATTKEPSEIAPVPQKDVVSADIISGAPGMSVPLERDRVIHHTHLLAELRHRVVRIYQPTRNTMQSGGAKGNRWRLDWDILPGGGRWENPLMGWASSYVSRSKTQGVGVVIDGDAGRTMSKEPESRSDLRKMPFTLPKSKVSPPAFLSLKPTQDNECVLSGWDCYV